MYRVRNRYNQIGEKLGKLHCTRRPSETRATSTSRRIPSRGARPEQDRDSGGLRDSGLGVMDTQVRAKEHPVAEGTEVGV